MKPRPLNRPGNSDEAGESSPEKVDEQRLNDLEIEKKWLQLARLNIEKFELLYRKYRPKIFKFIMLIVKNEDVASNLTDETFSRAVDKLDSFKWQGYSFGAWLFQIARNVVRLDFRRRRTKPEVPYDPDIHDRDNGCRPDLDVEKLDDSRLLIMCLDRLKPDPKEVVINYYGLGMTTREVGVVMGISESAVKAHLQRSRKRLLKCLVANGMERGLSQSTMKIIRKSAVQEDGGEVLEADDGKSTERKPKAGD